MQVLADGGKQKTVITTLNAAGRLIDEWEEAALRVGQRLLASRRAFIDSDS